MFLIFDPNTNFLAGSLTSDGRSTVCRGPINSYDGTNLIFMVPQAPGTNCITYLSNFTMLSGMSNTGISPYNWDDPFLGWSGQAAFELLFQN